MINITYLESGERYKFNGYICKKLILDFSKNNIEHFNNILVFL